MRRSAVAALLLLLGSVSTARAAGLVVVQSELVSPLVPGVTFPAFAQRVASSGNRVLVAAPGGKGTVFVLRRENGRWVREATLTASGSGALSFGTAVALSGDTAAVATQGFPSGAVHIFKSDASGLWTLEQTISTSISMDASLVLDGDTLLIGSPPTLPFGSPRPVLVYLRSGSTWSLQGQLVSSSVADDGFGRGLALRGDRAFVGAPRRSVAGKVAGAVVIFTRSGTSWSETGLLSTPTPGPPAPAPDGEQFGAALALSDAGSELRLLVGAPTHKEGSAINAGQAHTFVSSSGGTVWTHEKTFVATQPKSTAYFGGAVALSSDTAVLGNAGGIPGVVGERAHVSLLGSGWGALQTLDGGSGQSAAAFGTSVAMFGTAVLVGAPGYDFYAAKEAGALYVFNRAGATFVDGPVLDRDNWPGDRAGEAVAVYGATAAVGLPAQPVPGLFVFDVQATGSVQLYGISSTTGKWSAGQKLLPATGASESFGAALALDASTLAVGAPSYDGGDVYLYKYQGVSWVSASTLTPTDGQSGDKFGQALALSGDTLVVGAPGHAAPPLYEVGAAYVYLRQNGVWALQQKLMAATPASREMLGSAVAIDGDTLVLGAPGSKRAQGLDASGAALVFQRSGASWTEVGWLLPSDPWSDGHFGKAVALRGDRLVVGAPDQPQYPGPMFGVGAAYLFERTAGTWKQALKIASGSAPLRYFGAAVALSDTILAIGAPGHAVAGQADTGTVHVLGYGRLAWSERAQVVSDVTQPGARFGAALALDGTTLIVGAPRKDFDAGAARALLLVLAADGESCLSDDACLSLTCEQGTCCDKLCDGPCRSCKGVGSTPAGTCAPLDPGSEVTTTPGCSGDSACDGQGACRKKAGRSCATPGDCASGYCVDNICCATACDKTCESCAVPGSEGTCTAIAANSDPDNECIGIDAACGGSCNGQRACDFPGAGTNCGSCRACDGTGRCAATPEDDDACGVIDCDSLDSACRDYVDIKSKRCASFGKCKPANDPATCLIYADTCGDGGVAADGGKPPSDGGVGQADGGASSSGSSGGCAVAARAPVSADGLLWLLLALTALGLRRR